MRASLDDTFSDFGQMRQRMARTWQQTLGPPRPSTR
jgi:hypothetical protein